VESEFVRGMWSENERALALHAFGAHALLEAPAREADWPGKLPAQFRRVHGALTQTRLTTLALWLLGSDADRLDAVGRRIAAGARPRRFAADLGRGALAARRYAEAAHHFATARETRPRDRSLPRLELYSLCMASKFQAADRLARAIGRRDAEAGWWRWLEATFDVTLGGA
jgi:hypothetical protein